MKRKQKINEKINIPTFLERWKSYEGDDDT